MSVNDEPKTNNPEDSIKSIYRLCIDTRNFEINQLIQRNNFFMLFQGVLFAGVLQNEASKPTVELVVCLIGVLVSYYQLQMASGAKFWQEWWEIQVEQYENKLKEYKSKESANQGSADFHDLFTTSKSDVQELVVKRLTKNGNRKSLTDYLVLNSFSVSRAPIKVSLVLLSGWVLLTLHSLNFEVLFSCFDSINLIKGFTFNK